MQNCTYVIKYSIAFAVRIFTNSVTTEWRMYILHAEYSLHLPLPREIITEINLCPDGLHCAEFHGRVAGQLFHK